MLLKSMLRFFRVAMECVQVATIILSQALCLLQAADNPMRFKRYMTNASNYMKNMLRIVFL